SRDCSSPRDVALRSLPPSPVAHPRDLRLKSARLGGFQCKPSPAGHHSQNSRMEQPLPDSELVVATPERVSFDYQVAGLGTRAIAQVLDLLIVTALLVAIFFGGLALGAITNNSVVFDLIEILGSFVI